MLIDIDLYNEDVSYKAGYDDGNFDGYDEGYDMGYGKGYRDATEWYETELKQLRDALRAILDRGEAPEREISR